MLKRVLNRLTVFVVALSIAFVVYVLSYAPYLRVVDQDSVGFPYRSPEIYRPVDYLIVETPLRQPLQMWATLWNAEDLTGIQAWIYIHGYPVHINFQHE